MRQSTVTGLANGKTFLKNNGVLKFTIQTSPEEDSESRKTTSICVGTDCRQKVSGNSRACAGAQAGRSYGDADTLLSEYAHYDANSSKRSWPVGQLKPNAFGLFDMYGNAMEWCASRYGPYNVDREEGAASERKSLLDTVEEGEVLPKSSRVLRGGWFGSSDMLIRSADRGYSQPVSTGKYTGFRLTRTVLD